MALSPEEAVACLDLLRTLPDPWADEWFWLVQLAEDVGLQREDLAGLTFLDAVAAVRQMEDFWGMGTVLDDWSLQLRSRHEGEIRAALVQGMNLPLLAQRLGVSQLVDLAHHCFVVCPKTFRLTQVAPVEVTVEVPYLDIGRVLLRKECP